MIEFKCLKAVLSLTLLKGTLMQIWKSDNIFVFAQKNMLKILH